MANQYAENETLMLKSISMYVCRPINWGYTDWPPMSFAARPLVTQRKRKQPKISVLPKLRLMNETASNKKKTTLHIIKIAIFFCAIL